MADDRFIRLPRLETHLYPLVEGYRCVSVYIPDDDAYMPVLGGYLSLLTKSWFWRGVREDAIARSQQWLAAYALNEWMACMNCDDIADCIDENENVRSSLGNWLNEVTSGNTPGRELTRLERKETIIPPDTDCDPEILCGIAENFVDWLNLNNVDFLEKFEVVTNPIENLSALFSSFAGIDPTVFGTAITTWLNFIQDALNENYAAEYTTAYRNQVAFDLRCLMLDNCALSLDDAYLYFSKRVGNPTLPDTLLNAVVFWTTGIWTGTQFCDIMMLTQIAAFRFGNFFLGILGLPSIKAALQAGKDQPNDDCDTWGYTCPAGVQIFSNIEPVPANDTIRNVIEGMDYDLVSTGTWQYGTGISYTAAGSPDFNASAVIPTAPLCSLIGRVGETGDWFLIGASAVITMPNSGRLYLICNDVPGTYGDNVGYVTTTITEI